ncbi:hypothetical protein ACHAWO_010177, partial [Cyclotella atomus]
MSTAEDDDDSISETCSLNSCEEFLSFESIRDPSTNLETSIRFSWPQVYEIEVDCSSPDSKLENSETPTEKKLRKITISTLLEEDDIAPIFDGSRWAGTRLWDLCSVSYEDTPTQPPLVNTVEKSTQMRVKPEPIIAQIITILQHVCDLQNAVHEFRPSTMGLTRNAPAEIDYAVNGERNSSDDESHDGREDDITRRTTCDNSNDVTFKSTVKDDLKDMEKYIIAIASYTKMSGTTNCRSILIHQRYNDIKELGTNVLALSINRYLTLAVQHPQSPAMIKNYTELKRGDLKLIVENFG